MATKQHLIPSQDFGTEVWRRVFNKKQKLKTKKTKKTTSKPQTFPRFIGSISHISQAEKKFFFFF